MQAVSKIVAWQLNLLSCNRDLTLIDAVGVTTNGCAEIAGVIDRIGILRNVVISQHYIGSNTGFVGYAD